MYVPVLQFPQDVASRLSFSFATVHSKYPLSLFSSLFTYAFKILPSIFTLKMAFHFGIPLSLFPPLCSAYWNKMVYDFTYWLKTSINFERHCGINSNDFLEMQTLKLF